MFTIGYITITHITNVIKRCNTPVSYTHLTLPTKLEV